jgi:hypothetical protein
MSELCRNTARRFPLVLDAGRHELERSSTGARSRLEGQASIRGGRGPPAASRALSQNGYGSNARTQQIFAARVRRDNYVLGTWYLVQSQRSTVMVVESCHPKGV